MNLFQLAENPDQKLFPGMTATLSIETARAENVLAVAAAAFRFRPKDEDFERVFGRKADKRRKLYNGMIKCQVYMYFKGVGNRE